MRRANAKRSPCGSVLFAGLTLIAVTACGGGIDPAIAAADAQIAKLLPNATAAVVRIASLDTINSHIASIAAATGEADQAVDVRDLLQMAPLPLGDTRLIDGSLPIALAVTSKRATPPSVALLVPATDADKYLESLNAANVTATVAGNYIAIPIFGKYEPSTTPSTIMANMQPGAVAIHGDLGTLAKNYKVMIDSGLELFVKSIADEMDTSNPGIDGEAIAEMYADAARAITQSATAVDISLDYKDGTIEFYSTLDVRPGSSMSGWSSPAIDLKPLAKGMTGNGALEVLFQMDMEKLAPRYDALVATAIDIYPEQFKAPMRELMAAYRDIYSLMSGGMALEGDMFGEDGIRMTAQMAPSSPSKFVEKMTAMLSSDAMKKIGLVVKDAKASETGATKTSDMTLGFDLAKIAALVGGETPQANAESDAAMKALFGDGLTLHTAVRDGRLIMTSGKDRAETATKTLDATTGSWSAAVQPALDRVVDCNPMVVERLDFGALMSGIATTMGAPKPPKASSANMIFYGGIKGEQWRAGFSMDVAGIAKMVQQMAPR